MTGRVPQGSVLRFLLFLIFINDGAEEVANCVKTFTDDMKIGVLWIE